MNNTKIIVYSALREKEETLLQNKPFKNLYAPEIYRKELCSITINLGRRMGHTSAIVGLCNDVDDLIITTNGATKHHIKYLLQEKYSVFDIALKTLWDLGKDGKLYDRIWIDNASFLSRQEKNTIYDCFDANTYIFLG